MPDTTARGAAWADRFEAFTYDAEGGAVPQEAAVARASAAPDRRRPLDLDPFGFEGEATAPGGGQPASPDRGDAGCPRGEVLRVIAMAAALAARDPGLLSAPEIVEAARALAAALAIAAPEKPRMRWSDEPGAAKAENRRRRNPAQFIRDVYGDETGSVIIPRAMIGKLDPALGTAYATYVNRNPDAAIWNEYRKRGEAAPGEPKSARTAARSR